MATMGRHSPPLNGTVAPNGHQSVPLVMAPMRPRGPVSALPQDDPGQSRTEPDRPRRGALVMSAFRRNWWRLVFAVVGAVAAIVSYGHIVNLFLTWHAPLYDARLMPIAIDGLIIIGAGAAKGGQKWLGWSAIGPGLAASLYANVMNGLPYGWGAAMGSGWATIALFLATNVMERWKPAPPAKATPLSESTPVVPPHEDKRTDKQPDKTRDKPGQRRPVPARTALDKASAAIRDNPGVTDLKALAKLADVSTKTIQRAKNGKGSKT